MGVSRQSGKAWGRALPQESPLANAHGASLAGLHLSAPTLVEAAARLPLAISEAQAGLLVRYADLLVRWSRVHNLTAIRTRDEIFSHHLLDCLSLAALMMRWQPKAASRAPLSSASGGRILDVGSGGGLPAVPLAIVFPLARVTAADLVDKKCAFLRHVRAELELPQLQVHHGAVQDLAADGFDHIVSRALGTLSDFTGWTDRLINPGGLWWAMKGKVPEMELVALAPGVEVLETVKLHIDELGEERHVVIMRPSPARNA